MNRLTIRQHDNVQRNDIDTHRMSQTRGSEPNAERRRAGAVFCCVCATSRRTRHERGKTRHVRQPVLQQALAVTVSAA